MFAIRLGVFKVEGLPDVRAGERLDMEHDLAALKQSHSS
jgi:hypothetical protein